MTLENDEGDIWAVEELRYREWRVSSLHWTYESARSMLDRLASIPGHDPARWRVEPWLVLGASEADDSTFGPIAFQVDDKRFENVMDKTARAIWFAHYGEKLLCPLHIHSPAFRAEDMKTHEDVQALATVASAAFTNEKDHGANPDVFTYNISPEPKDEVKVVRLRFYRGFDVIAVAVAS